MPVYIQKKQSLIVKPSCESMKDYSVIFAFSRMKNYKKYSDFIINYRYVGNLAIIDDYLFKPTKINM